jgi:hypothetical protein
LHHATPPIFAHDSPLPKILKSNKPSAWKEEEQEEEGKGKYEEERRENEIVVKT